MTALLLIALLAAPDVHVSITPDQPLPFAYVDEPLVVEVSSPTAKEASVRVEIDGSRGSVSSYNLGAVDLSENGDHWRALESVALPRDRYRARFTITADGMTTRLEQSFCRIDRPVPGYTFPLSANANGNGKDNLALAVSAIPGRAVRFEAGSPELDARIDKAREAGLQAVLGLQLSRMTEPAAETEALTTRLGDKVARWDIEGADTPATVAAVAETIRRGHPRAAIGLVVRDAAGLARLMEAGAGRYATAVVLDEASPEPGDLLALRDVAERAGFEGLSLVSLSRGVDRGALIEQGQRVVKQLLQNLSVGAESVLDSELILNNQGFGDGYVNLCGMAHRLQNASYAGELDLTPGVRSQALRVGDGWVLVLWSKGAALDITLRLPQATDLNLTDARNNPLPLPPAVGDALNIRIGPEPVYLGGKGGSVLVAAARRAALREAQSILAIKDTQKRLPVELVDIVRTVSQRGAGAVDRRSFLALMNVFPALEEARESGKLPVEVAVPASAGLARLLRNLCVVENDRGEPFLEPLQEMLAKCSGYTSKYLTGAANGDSHNRQDWLLSEVARLMGEAKQLEEAGRATEADAVAALAEGRARALEHAAEGDKASG
jgi:hypothetical protein